MYCDIVVTERKWTSYIASSGIDTLAVVLTDLSDLPSHLLLPEHQR